MPQMIINDYLILTNVLLTIKLSKVLQQTYTHGFRKNPNVQLNGTHTRHITNQISLKLKLESWRIKSA